MRTVLIAPGLAPPEAGGGAQAIHSDVNALAQHATVDLVVLRDPGTDSSTREQLARRGVKVHFPATPGNQLAEHDIGRLIRALRPDTVQVEAIGTAHQVRRCWPRNVASVLRAFDATWDVLGGAIASPYNVPNSRLAHWAARLGCRKLWLRRLVAQEKRRELRAARDYDLVACYSQRDRVLFAREGIQAVLATAYVEPSTRAHQPTPSNSFRLCFVGGFTYFPNVDAAAFLLNEILPRVPSEIPITCHVAGREPPASIRRFHDGTRVFVHGYVDDLSALYSETDVFVIPLRIGGGIKLKTLHALGHGLPVVSMPRAVDGIDAEDGTHILIRQGASEFVDALYRLWRDPSLRTKLGQEGRRLVAREHSLAVAARGLFSAHRAALEHMQFRTRSTDQDARWR